DFKQNLVEIGAGYFTTFGVKDDQVIEVYAGVGRGNTDKSKRDKQSDGTYIYDVQEINFNKSFLQVNYSTKKERSLRLFGNKYPLNYGTALRASYVNMNNFVRNDLKQAKEDNIFLEPIF